MQGGVFSTEESAQEVQALLHEKNVPAEVFQVDKNYYVFLGAAENLEATKELALLYKTHDIDVFWKEIDFTTKLDEGESRNRSNSFCLFIIGRAFCSTAT